MNANSVYAVVDIETTGTNVAEGNRMIQVSCVLVQNQRVINQFSSDVNPQMKIPQAIKNLTGISDAQVKRAPLFDDIAGTLYSLLTGTVFVAHNVNFDFPFLNAELERVGYPALEIEAIDTVTLSQVLWPTVPSYRLHDLTSTLHIKHLHPHSAEDDALVTAQLLIKLFEKMATLPIVTLQKMVAVNAELPQNTAEVFNWGLTEAKKHPGALRDELYVRHGLALKKVTRQISHLKAPVAYPRTKKSKLKHYPKQFEWRPDQAKMMNLIYRHYKIDLNDRQPLIVEAPTGTGKTLGYMLPLAYLVQETGKQAVIATDTVLLQSQLADSTVPLLKQMLPFEVTVSVVKGNQHYLDLTRFAQSLDDQNHSKQSQLIKLRLLVWLTETVSGDLDELHFRNDPPYLETVRHRGINQLDVDAAFYEDDFLRRLYDQLPNSELVIVNHAFLVQKAQTLGETFHQPYLVVDEAQHLADYAMRSQRQKFDFQLVLNRVSHLQHLIAPDNEYGLAVMFNEAPFTDDLGTISTWLTEFDHQLSALSNHFLSFFRNQLDTTTNLAYAEITITADQFHQFMEQQTGLLEQLDILQNKLNERVASFADAFEAESEKWLLSEKKAVQQLVNDVGLISETWAVLTDMRDASQVEQLMYWLAVSSDHNHLILTSSLVSVRGYLSKQVYQFFEEPVFTGATLFSSNRSQYLYDELDLDRNHTKVRRLKSDFNFETQAQLYVSKTAPNVLETDAYVNYLSTAIDQLTRSIKRPTLVLFNALSTLEAVYHELVAKSSGFDRMILAQGISGGKEKIIKRFMDEEHAVLLGAGSFWEGIDLPQDKLQLLIITRLPFDPPDRLEVKARYNQLKAANKSPFYNLALPKATLRLRQGVGRLIRTRDDYGVVVVLDSRLATRQYGKTMLKTLPESLPVAVEDLSGIDRGIQKFFKKHRSSTQE